MHVQFYSIYFYIYFLLFSLSQIGFSYYVSSTIFFKHIKIFNTYRNMLCNLYNIFVKLCELYVQFLFCDKSNTSNVSNSDKLHDILDYILKMKMGCLTSVV